MELSDDQVLEIASQIDRGRRIRVTAIFHDATEANEYLRIHSDEAVVDEWRPYVFIGKVQDLGHREEE